jgi:glutaminyl-tRNA synthetase
VLVNYPADREEALPALNNPEDPGAGTRSLPFSRELWIERDDFLEDPPAKFHRLAPGREVRLRFAYLVTCTGVVKDPATGEIVELRCRYDPATRGGDAPDGRKVKATLHWVSAAHATSGEVRLYEPLFAAEFPGSGDDGDFRKDLNPRSLEVIADAKLEPGLAAAEPGARFQFERLGYFCADPCDHRPGVRPIFNRTVGLRDAWARIVAQGAASPSS